MEFIFQVMIPLQLAYPRHDILTDVPSETKEQHQGGIVFYICEDPVILMGMVRSHALALRHRNDRLEFTFRGDSEMLKENGPFGFDAWRS